MLIQIFLDSSFVFITAKKTKKKSADESSEESESEPEVKKKKKHKKEKKKDKKKKEKSKLVPIYLFINIFEFITNPLRSQVDSRSTSARTLACLPVRDMHFYRRL